jgi:hypothetical protein
MEVVIVNEREPFSVPIPTSTVWGDTEQGLHQIPLSGDVRHIIECVHDIGQALREAPSLPSLETKERGEEV